MKPNSQPISSLWREVFSARLALGSLPQAHKRWRSRPRAGSRRADGRRAGPAGSEALFASTRNLSCRSDNEGRDAGRPDDVQASPLCNPQRESTNSKGITNDSFNKFLDRLLLAHLLLWSPFRSVGPGLLSELCRSRACCARALPRKKGKNVTLLENSIGRRRPDGGETTCCYHHQSG